MRQSLIIIYLLIFNIAVSAQVKVSFHNASYIEIGLGVKDSAKCIMLLPGADTKQLLFNGETISMPVYILWETYYWNELPSIEKDSLFTGNWYCNLLYNSEDRFWTTKFVRAIDSLNIKK